MITPSHYLAHTQPLSIDLLVLSPDKLVLNRIGIIMYKIYNGLLPQEINVLYIILETKIIIHTIIRSSNLL